MNLGAIKKVCGGGKRATVYRSMGGGGQWISNGCAAYLVRGVVIESPKALMELWNLSAKAREKAIIREDITSDIRFRPTSADEEQLELLGVAGMNEIGHFVALGSARGVIWIDAEWLNPLKLDYARYFARWTDGGRPIVAVYEDLSGADALILPVSNAIATAISNAAAGMAAPAFHWPDDDEEAAEAEAAAEAMLNDMEGEDEDG